jgi:hypothetical protein
MCQAISSIQNLNFSGKAFRVGDQHFSSVYDTLNGLKYMRIKTKNLNGKRPSRHYAGRIVTFTLLADLVRFPCMRLVFMMPYLHNLYIIINRRRWGIIFRQYLWNILMFNLSYPTTEPPFRLKNVPSDVTFLLQIDQIFWHFTKT